MVQQISILSPAIKTLLMSSAPNRRIIKAAITFKRLDVLVRIEDHILSANNGYLGIKASNWALALNNINAFIFLDSKGFVPNTRGINKWMSGCCSKIDALQWLEKRNMSITDHNLDDPIISGADNQNIINILQWSYERGIVPTQQEITHAIDNDLPDIIQWLEEHELL